MSLSAEPITQGLQLLVDLYGIFVDNISSFSSDVFCGYSQNYVQFMDQLNQFLQLYPLGLIFDFISRITTFYKRLFLSHKRNTSSSSIEFILFNELIEQVQKHFATFSEWNRHLMNFKVKSDFKITKETLMSRPCPKFILESEVIVSDRQIRVFDWIVDLGRLEETKRESLLAKYGNAIRIDTIDEVDKKVFTANLQYAVLPNTMAKLIYSQTMLASFAYNTESQFDMQLSVFSAYIGRVRYIAELAGSMVSTALDTIDMPVRYDIGRSEDIGRTTELDAATLLTPQFSQHNLHQSLKLLVDKVTKVLEYHVEYCSDYVAIIKGQLLRTCQIIIRRHQEREGVSYAQLCVNPLQKADILCRPMLPNVKGKWREMVSKIVPSFRWSLIFQQYFNRCPKVYQFNKELAQRHERELKAIVTFILDEEKTQSDYEDRVEKVEFVSNILFRSSRLPPYYCQLPIKSKMAYLHAWIRPLFEAQLVTMVNVASLSQSVSIDLRSRYLKEAKQFISEGNRKIFLFFLSIIIFKFLPDNCRARGDHLSRIFFSSQFNEKGLH